MTDQAAAMKRFYEIEQEKMLLDFEKISLFTKHPTSLGTFRESRLRQYLREFTPRQLSMGTGFVSSFPGPNAGVIENQSRQIDCLVFDESKRHPELRTDDYVIVRPEALFAAIEIKSELTFYQKKARKNDDPAEYPLERLGKRYRWGGTLIDALQNIKSIVDVCPSHHRKIFCGIFGYGSTFDLHTMAHAFDNDEIQEQLGIRHIDQLPSAICIPGKSVVHPSPYDFLEKMPHHDSSTSFLNVIESTDQSSAYPLQFFTTFYLNKVGHSLTGANVETGGVNSSASGPLLVWRKHFDLNSEGYEDQ